MASPAPPPTPLVQEQLSPPILLNIPASAPPETPASETDQAPSTSLGRTPFNPPDTDAPSASPITLKRLSPAHGPLSGQEPIVAIGSGFRAEQKLVLRFGHNVGPTMTTFMAPNNLDCVLPPYHTAGPVIVTLHSPDEPGLVSRDNQVIFTYEDVQYKL